MIVIVNALFNCTVLLQAMARPNGPAGQCFNAMMAGQVDLHISRFILEELRDVASRPSVMLKLKLTAARSGKFLDLLCTYGRLIKTPPEVFHGCRDPDDNQYVDLALGLEEPVIVSRGKDLLDLRLATNSVSHALRTLCPELRILTPPEFLALFSGQK